MTTQETRKPSSGSYHFTTALVYYHGLNWAGCGLCYDGAEATRHYVTYESLPTGSECAVCGAVLGTEYDGRDETGKWRRPNGLDQLTKAVTS